MGKLPGVRLEADPFARDTGRRKVYRRHMVKATRIKVSRIPDNGQRDAFQMGTTYLLSEKVLKTLTKIGCAGA
jgi:hypothetical protein